MTEEIMLPKNRRLNLSREFKKVASGKKAATPLFKLMYIFTDDIEPRIGIALSKAQFKKAHERNIAKRLCASAAQIVYPNLKRNLNLVIMPRTQILEEKVEKVVEELKNVHDIYQTY